jgi:hypothetical protein
MKNVLEPLAYEHQHEATKKAQRFVCRVCFTSFSVQPMDSGDYGLLCTECEEWARESNVIEKEEAEVIEWERTRNRIDTFPLDQPAEDSLKELGF